MAAGTSGHVGTGEGVALLREATRLLSDGAGGATPAERESYKRRKADLLARVAACDSPGDRREKVPGQGGAGGES